MRHRVLYGYRAHSCCHYHRHRWRHRTSCTLRPSLLTTPASDRTDLRWGSCQMEKRGRRWWGCKQMLVARFSLLQGGGVRWLSYRKVKYPGWRRAILKKHMMQVPGLRCTGFLTRRLNCPPLGKENKIELSLTPNN